MSDNNNGSDRGGGRRTNTDNRHNNRGGGGRGIGIHLYRQDHDTSAYSALADAPTSPSQPTSTPDTSIPTKSIPATAFPPLPSDTAAYASHLKDAEIAKLAADLAAATAKAAALQEELDAFARWLRQAPGSALLSTSTPTPADDKDNQPTASASTPVGESGVGGSFVSSSEGSKAPETFRQRTGNPQGSFFFFGGGGNDRRGGGRRRMMMMMMMMTQDARFDGGSEGGGFRASSNYIRGGFDSRGGFGDQERGGGGWRGGRGGGRGGRDGRGGPRGGRGPRSEHGGYSGGGASAGGGWDDVGADATKAVGGWDQPDGAGNDGGSAMAKVGDWE